MPYFVFRITPAQPPTLVNTHDKYRDARAEVRALREQAHRVGDKNAFRLIFGQDVREAKRLVSTTREPASPLEEWEEKA